MCTVYASIHGVCMVYFYSGLIADRINLRYFLTVGMIGQLTGVVEFNMFPFEYTDVAMYMYIHVHVHVYLVLNVCTLYMCTCTHVHVCSCDAACTCTCIL